MRVGRTADFSSKIVHAVQSLHSRGVLSAPMTTAALAGESAVTAMPSEKAAVERCEMHFWVFCEWLQAAECLPVDSRAKNPILLADGAMEGPSSYILRSRAALVTTAVVAALARSHGARNDTRLTLVFADAALTVDSSLIGKFLGRRGYGALTEHHILCGLADAARSAKHAKACDFEEAWARWGTKMAQTVSRRRRREAADNPQVGSRTQAICLCVLRDDVYSNRLVLTRSFVIMFMSTDAGAARLAGPRRGSWSIHMYRLRA